MTVEDAVTGVAERAMRRAGRRPAVAPFLGYGRAATTDEAGWVRLGGRVLLGSEQAVEANPRVRVLAGLRRFATAEVPRAQVRVGVDGHSDTLRADRDGYLDAVVEVALPPGWHDVTFEVEGRTTTGRVLVLDAGTAEGRGLAVVSDVDDTVIETGITNLVTMVRTTLLVRPEERVTLPGAPELYRALAHGSAAGSPRPVFYLSTSPWNLYDALLRFLTARDFPLGPLLLTDWGPGQHGLLRIAGPAHKLTALRRLLDDFPGLDLVLVGDSGQADPEIYAEIAREAAGRVRAVYIREVPARPLRTPPTRALAAEVTAAGTPMLLVRDSTEIAEHAAGLGLLDESAVADIRRAVEAEKAAAGEAEPAGR